MLAQLSRRELEVNKTAADFNDWMEGVERRFAQQSIELASVQMRMATCNAQRNACKSREEGLWGRGATQSDRIQPPA